MTFDPLSQQPWPLALAIGALLFAVFYMIVVRVDRALRYRMERARGAAAMALPSSREAPLPPDVAELREIVIGLVVDRRWAVLAEVLELLLARRVDASDGRRMYDVAMDAALATVHDAPGLSGLSAALRPFAEAAAESGGTTLTLLHCRALSCALCRAEAMADPAADAMARTWAHEVEEVVSRLHLRPASVPALAEASYHAAAILRPDPVKTATRFRLWQEADPGSGRPYLAHARRLAALGAVGRAELTAHLHEVALASRRQGGPGLLLRVRLAAAGARPLTTLDGVSAESVLIELHEVADRPGGQEIVNAYGARALADGDEALARAIVHDLMSHWITAAWPDHEGFYALYWRACRGEGGRGVERAAAPQGAALPA